MRRSRRKSSARCECARAREGIWLEMSRARARLARARLACVCLVESHTHATIQTRMESMKLPLRDRILGLRASRSDLGRISVIPGALPREGHGAAGRAVRARSARRDRRGAHAHVWPRVRRLGQGRHAVGRVAARTARDDHRADALHDNGRRPGASERTSAARARVRKQICSRFFGSCRNRRCSTRCARASRIERPTTRRYSALS